MHHSGGKQWYVIYTKPKGEELACFHLRLKGIDVFFPRLLLPGSLRKRKPMIPLFPNYLFVRIQIFEGYHHVAWSPGVKRFVAFNSIPTPLDVNVVKYLMQQANSDGIIKARSKLKVGEEVLMNGGPFEGLIGIIKEPPNAKGRLRVLLDLLSRQVQVEVPLSFCNSGWIASAEH